MAWYDDVFEGLYDQFTFHLFTESLNRGEAEFIVNALDLQRGEHVLDCPCGYGRHAALLVKKGIRVTGIDKTERYIKSAKENIKDPPGRFLVGDIRNLDFEEEFDAIYNFFTSFGYFDDETNFDILKSFSRSLKPNGRLLIDIQNRELYITGDKHYQEHSEFSRDGIDYVMTLDSDFDIATSRVVIRQRLFGHPDGPKSMEFEVRLYSMSELHWLLRLAGLEIVKTYGDTDATPYSMTSLRCIVVAQKL